MFNEITKKPITVLLAFIAGTAFLYAESSAQVSNFSAPQSTGTFPPPPANSGSIITTPPATLQQPNFAPPMSQPMTGSGLVTPPVTPPMADPFSSQPQAFPQGNQQLGPPPQIFYPPATPPPGGAPVYPAPQAQAVTSNTYQPSYQGTGTNWLPAFDWPQEPWSSFQDDFLPRVFEHPRARQTYMPGSGGNEMNINDLELATTLNWANFFGGPQPLKISPGFIFHWWGGPDSAAYPGFDMPARAYSSYIAADHVTDPQKVSGLESNLTVGYYSDFVNTSSNGFRLTGKLVGWYRVNPYTVGKFGLEYFDRVNVKLLPAFGVYMTPNSDMKFDLSFPKMKLAHRMANIRNSEAWTYFGAEYGGGSWAIRRADDTNDQADINDVRAYFGVEWRGPKCVTGFFEFGYVFNREIVYRSNAIDTLELQDTIMIRSGFAF